MAEQIAQSREAEIHALRNHSQAQAGAVIQNQEAAIQAALQKLGGLVHVQLNPAVGDELDLYVTTWSVVNGKVSESEGAFGSVGGK